MSFRGFDASAYPGDDAMRDLRASFDVVGFYLRGPSHPDQSWLGKRAFLQDELKYGLLPIFVGQETVGPGEHIVTADQGCIDGAEAASRMKAEGFAAGSHVYFDLENGPPFGGAQFFYVKGCVDACQAEGMAGALYCSHAFAPTLALKLPGVPLWVFRVPTVSRTTAAAPFVAPNVVLGGYSNAVAWQYRQNVGITVAGHSLVVDLDAAALADPSAPAISPTPT